MPLLRLISLSTLCLLTACASTARPRPALTRTVVIPPGWDSAYDTYHYAPAVRVGDTVVVSGIPASGGDTYEAKIRGMFERLKSVLDASGASLADVVEITTFHAQVHGTEEFQGEFSQFLKIHKEYFTSTYPAWTAVGTTALLAKDAPVEMRAVAIVGSGVHAQLERKAHRSP
ncbi:MAG: Rid family hydrolase [Tahibacter sp.]